MNLAHVLTILRICISPLLPILYLKSDWLGIPMTVLPFLMLFILAICEWTDVLDGKIARKRNEVTDLGKVLDPMADSIVHISLFLSFTQGIVQLPMLVVLIFFYRDLFISTLRTLCALKGLALAARASGKIKTVLQGFVAVLICMMMIPYAFGFISLESLQNVSLIATSIAAIYTLGSMLDYVYANLTYIKKAFK